MLAVHFAVSDASDRAPAAEAVADAFDAMPVAESLEAVLVLAPAVVSEPVVVLEQAWAAVTFASAALGVPYRATPSPGLEALAVANDEVGAALSIAAQSTRGAFDSAAVDASDFGPDAGRKVPGVFAQQQE